MPKQNDTKRAHGDRHRHRRRADSIADLSGEAQSDCTSPTFPGGKTPAGRDSTLGGTGQGKLMGAAGGSPARSPKHRRPQSPKAAPSLPRSTPAGQKHQAHEESSDFESPPGHAESATPVDSPMTLAAPLSFMPLVTTVHFS
ncbi:hypothetical protein MTO96_024999 [Rhipicephalus appendiculatus]